MLQHIIANTSGAKVRHDTMEGREFLVVPMVMLTEGVHAGSNGPLYYPADELGKVPVVWNHKPIVVYHPEINGVGVSACDPTILTARKIGVVMNATFDGRLVAEAWLEKSRVQAVDSRIMESIEKGQMVELSTGLFTDNQSTDGEWKGEKYGAIARNYRPDHLAILPDRVGACSIKDGAGLLRNQGEPIVANAQSYQNIMEAVRSAIRQKSKDKLSGSSLYVADIYHDFAVYEDEAGKLWKQGYKMDNLNATLDGEPVEVVRVIEYRTPDGTFVGNGSITNQERGSTVMDKKPLVDKLIANAKSGATEADRAALTALPDAVLTAMVANADPQPVPAEKPEEKTPAPAANVTPEEYIAKAPPAIRDMLGSGLAAHNAQRDSLVQRIVANRANVFTPAQLSAKPLGELQAIAALASAGDAAPMPNYAGAAAPAPTGNASAEEPLPLPVMNFGK